MLTFFMHSFVPFIVNRKFVLNLDLYFEIPWKSLKVTGGRGFVKFLGRMMGHLYRYVLSFALPFALLYEVSVRT